MSINIKIVTPEKVVFEDTADSITLTTESGQVTILPNHIDLVSNLKAGEMILKKEKEIHYMVTSTGFLEVKNGKDVIVLADTADRADDLELEQIEEAKERAIKLLAEKRGVDDIAFADATAMLERELARHRVAIKRKKYRDIK
jgi:F-type H+-transporting ATPase subunit epsilon